MRASTNLISTIQVCVQPRINWACTMHQLIHKPQCHQPTKGLLIPQLGRSHKCSPWCMVLLPISLFWLCCSISVGRFSPFIPNFREGVIHLSLLMSALWSHRPRVLLAHKMPPVWSRETHTPQQSIVGRPTSFAGVATHSFGFKLLWAYLSVTFCSY